MRNKGRVLALSLVLGSSILFFLGSDQRSWAKGDRVPQVRKKMIPEGSVGPPAPATWTVYVDGGGGRTGSAEDLNELHRVMNRKGWSFADMEIRVENGDLTGYFVTYVALSASSRKDGD